VASPWFPAVQLPRDSAMQTIEGWPNLTPSPLDQVAIGKLPLLDRPYEGQVTRTPQTSKDY